MTPHHSCGVEWKYLLHDALSGGVQSTHVSKGLFPTDQKKGACFMKKRVRCGRSSTFIMDTPLRPMCLKCSAVCFFHPPFICCCFRSQQWAASPKRKDAQREGEGRTSTSGMPMLEGPPKLEKKMPITKPIAPPARARLAEIAVISKNGNVTSMNH